ncbi:MAG: sulfatase [Spirochaetota bacterium]
MDEKKKYTRRKFLGKSAVMAGTAAVGTSFIASTGCSKSFSTDPDKPNIILITADDLGWKDPGCYGNREISTPNIDRLSKEGLKFTRAFVVASSCAPSRASLITGQYPHTNGVTGLTHIYKTKSLSPFHATLPGMLADAGYNTALIGKWHPSPYLPTGWYGYNERLSGMLPKTWKIKDAKKINDYIKRNKDNRFYIEINFLQNHRDDFGEFRFSPDFPVDPKKVNVPDYWTLPNWPEIREEVAKFYSQTMEMDAVIGDILNELDNLGLAENTIVVFMSDNGPPFPGNKMTLYDRGTGTPLLMRWPKKIPAGKTCKGLVNTIDIMPTLLEAAGVDIPSGYNMQGESMAPAFSGPCHRLREAVFMEMTYHVHYLPTRAVRTDRFKYIHNYSDIAKGLDQCAHMEWAHRVCQLPNQPWQKPRVEEELYDLKKDPNEQHNLVGDPDYNKELQKMRALMEKHMKETNDPYLGHEFTHDYDQEMHKLRKPGKYD